MKLLKKGSVKDIYSDTENLLFKFSDRYSIYDWGEMPNSIPSKGLSLLNFTFTTFKFLENSKNWKEWEVESDKLKENYYICKSLNEFRNDGLNTHLIGKTEVDDDSFLSVQKMNIPNVTFKDESWNYSEYEDSTLINTLIPLEVIFRFSIPSGSSLLKRVGDASYLKVLGLSNAPIEGDEFAEPIIEFSTKLEEKDRYIDYDTARDISGMSCVEFESLKSKAILIALRLKDYFLESGLELCDGKFEFSYAEFDSEGKRNIKLIDSIGPDELRLTKDGVQLSKEVLRRFYEDSPWYSDLETAKKKAKDTNRIDWKDICIKDLGSTPDNLKDEQVELVSKMYQGLSLALVNDTKLLNECIPRIKEL